MVELASRTDDLTITPPAHPLDALSAEEIRTATRILRTERPETVSARVCRMTLLEPDKATVRAFSPGDDVPREVAVLLLDRSTGEVHEAVVDVAAGRLTSFDLVPDAQPSIMVEEFFAAADAVMADERWQEAMRLRGIEDFSLVQVDPWSAGNFGLGIESEHRLCRSTTYVRHSPTDNAYAHPVENLVAIVDLNTATVLRVEDHGVVPVPQECSNYDAASVTADVGAMRQVAPLEIVQPEGVGFTVEGNHVRWQNWDLRFSMDPNEGLVLHRVAWLDGDRSRTVLHRASVADMVVPYGDPSPSTFWKNAFDASEYGLGTLANPLELGCDCLGEIVYADAVFSDAEGQPFSVRNAVCMHEEDYGILWKHYDFRADTSETRRSRRFVISFVATIGNYEYGFYWYLYQDGTIQLEVKLTGIIQTAAVPDGATPEHGTLVAPGLYGPNHQHFFCARLDMEVDGPDNTCLEVEAITDPAGPDNPHGASFRAVATPLTRESEAQRNVDAAAGRYWKVVNPGTRNRLGQPVGYKLVPGYTPTLLARPESVIARRAAFTTRNLWVTAFDPTERHPAGTYTNQHPGGAGLTEWTTADRPLEDTDIVLWHTFGTTHVVRPEDWPVMPVDYTGFTLKPVGFFDRNPALNVPVAKGGHCSAG